MKYRFLVNIALVGLVISTGCTKLDETFEGQLTPEQAASGAAGVDGLLKGAYNAMRGPYQGQTEVWALEEHTSDECIGPTRGGDWDDNGIWRVLHAHRWTPDHAYINNTFNDLSGIIFSTTDLLQYNPSAQQAAEARFLRAFAMFDMLRFWNQVPYRDPGESTLEASRVRTGTEALDFIMSEVTAVMGDLPTTAVTRANQDAAKVLMMKCYFYKGVLANIEAPTFDDADMQQVITLADQIINSGKYSFTTNYFDNFGPNNGSLSTENIFTAENVGGTEGGDVRSRWYLGLHYNNNPSGWNGFTTLSDFYSKFDATDSRRTADYAGMTDVSGIKAGFLVGQQYNQNGDELKDRKGNPLVFTPEVHIKETNPNTLEVSGIRVMKYPIDYAPSNGTFANNDYVYYRYSDVLLLKAEALMNFGNNAEALTLVNEVRSARGISPLGDITMDALLDERGREFYWEAQRRSDLIRFGKFLTAWQEKEEDADSHYILFPIPNLQLSVNPNLIQNPGY